MKKGRKVILFFFLLVFSSFTILSGCSYKGVDKRSFVVGIGIDPGEGIEKKFKVTLKIAKPIPSLKSATENEYAYLVHESDSVAEAIRYLATEADKVFDFSQAKILALNPELLSGDLFHLMDYFVRRGDIQLLLYVIAAKPSAEEVLRVQPTLEAAGENSLYNFFDNTGTESPFVTTTFLFEFRRDYDTKGLSAVLPIVKGDGGGTKFIVNHALVLKHGHEAVELNLLETKLYNSLKKGESGYGYQINSAGYKFTLTIDRIKMKSKFELKNGQKPRVAIKIKAVGSVNESNKLLQLRELDHYNKISEDKLAEQVTILFKDLQEKNMDPFGFGLKYRATRLHTDKVLDDWKAIYPDLEFDVKVEVKLKSVGAIQ
ncbi:Ger(x)C family spore germination protein [Sporosarcina aquimarina]|uniref:Ger(X)C family spore germination protein n=1 Tax=Sporosarcina aquimarina TaxID=114975 RepID=A0ABU4G273_9BACL|nr:Ger(x)C family spore germination protein [Sporosarcina aquimarina]MDW0111079.1 Ger(x)C family spore germination protein [Sporosarcina aquimarina]